MNKRQKLIRVLLAAAMVLALCAMIPVVTGTWWAPQPKVNWNAWVGGAPGWLPQPDVNWNAWLGAPAQQLAFALPNWLPQPSVNWNS